MPSGVASPACSAIVQQFLAAGRPATPPGTSGPALAARSGRTGRRSDRSAHRRPPTTRQALPWPARPPRDRPMSTHLTMVTRWPPHPANQDQGIYGWSTNQADILGCPRFGGVGFLESLDRDDLVLGFELYG